jgi:aspartate/methionine/tyrosine aminotransferase
LNAYLEFSKHKIYIQEYIKESSRVFAHNQETVQATLDKFNIRHSIGTSCWYLLILLNEYETDFKKQDLHTSDDLQKYLADTLGIVTVSGNSFCCQENYTLRLSLVDELPIMIKGIECLSSWLNNI